MPFNVILFQHKITFAFLDTMIDICFKNLKSILLFWLIQTIIPKQNL